MKDHLQTAKNFIIKRNEIFIGIAIVLIVVISAAAIFISIQNSTPKIVYQPTKACDLFTATEAKELLGENTIRSSMSEPIQTKNTASSNCGYTDGNRDTENMIVAAIIVRSAINDDGIKQNNEEFTKGKPSTGMKDVEKLGDKAYFNLERGQLNVLKGRNWTVVSYGIGSAPETNTLEQSVELARKIVN